MESIWHVSECLPLAGLTLVMSLAYSRLKGTRHYADIVAASKQELSRLDDQEGALEKYKGREYYLILKALAEERTVTEYKTHVRSSGSFLSGLFVELYFRNNLDRKISNWIVGYSLVGIVAGSPPFLHWIPESIIANAIVVGSYSGLLVVALIFIIFLIANGEHTLRCAEKLIAKCGSELEGFRKVEMPSIIP